MESLGLVVGHLLGDYVLQNDWQARNKTNPHPGRRPGTVVKTAGGVVRDSDDGLATKLAMWDSGYRDWLKGHAACTVHCLLYTLSVFACSFWWMPWWGLVACFVVHWPVDRWRLAVRWMRDVSGQKAFATGPLAPWSIVVVDNTFHLLTLFVIGVAAGR